MSSFASFSGGESDYEYSLTVSEEERLCAIADRLSPPKPPGPTKHTPTSKASKASKSTALPPPFSTPSKSSRSFGQSHTQKPLETGPPSPLPQPHFHHPVPDFDDFDDPELNAALAQLTDEDLSFEISELDTPERPIPPKPKAQYVASTSTSSQQPGSFVGKKLPTFSQDDQRDEVSVASRSSQARTKVMQAYSDICYPDLSEALKEATEIPPAPSPNKQDNRPPIERFRTTQKKVLAVTDLTAGSWCELQHFYVITRRGGKRTTTEAMKAGTKIHDKLEREVFTAVQIKTSSKEEEMGIRVWNMIQGLRSLRDTGITRELQVWGMVDGNIVSGVIDCVSYENPDPELEDDVVSTRLGFQSSSQRLADLLPPGSQERKTEIFITDVKTRRTPNPPSKPQVHTSIIQLFLYHRFLSEMASDMLDYMHVFERYGVNPDQSFSDDFITQINDIPDLSPSTTTNNSPISKKTNHHFNETIYSNSDSDSGSDFETAIDSPSRLTPDASQNQYINLRSLIPLLKFEIQLTFPHGASDLGKIVAVEYRYRGENPVFDEDSDVERDEDPQAGRVICVNSFFVEPTTLDLYLEETMGWWKGEREPRGVGLEDAFKCKFCEFAPECDWRAKMEREFLRKMRSSKRKSAPVISPKKEKEKELEQVEEEQLDEAEETVQKKNKKKRKSKSKKKGEKVEEQTMGGNEDVGNQRIIW
ncbi:exonuclease V [Podospora fimiseda]|uniref:Exonuclease V n=1 Tax=Podospora fimiseda TaxID=252190 RepID=A0AAN7BS30_9PEZI|nr:exonuclease V [Podospora fimiseda]